jgi:hypothetical protein
VIDEREAETVRYIFRRYQELGCVRLLKEDLDRRGVVSKRRTSKTGIASGGAQANALLPSEARGARRIARDIGGSRPNLAFANSRHRHRIIRPQRENRSDAAFLDM